MKYFLIAGEASGDLHASHLIAALRERDAEAEFRFYGGDLMEEAATAPASEATAPEPAAPASEASTSASAPCSRSAEPAPSPLLRHYSTLAYMGFVQVALHARTILRGLAECKRAISEWRPDCIVLVDYPGFNLKIARWAKRELPATPIYYYISPKIWAWKEHRIRDIRANVDRLFSILPFEVDFYEGKHHYPISYVGNPTYDEVAAYLRERGEDISRIDTYGQNAKGRKRLVMKFHDAPEWADTCMAPGVISKHSIALLPGSRKQEIRDNLRIMLSAVGDFPFMPTITIAAAPGIDDAFYTAIAPEAHIVRGRTYDLLRSASAALVTSGTATLEAALLDVPQVVCYNVRGGRIVNWAKEHFLKCRWISLVNLIAGEEVVPELIAADMNPRNVSRHLASLLPFPDQLEIKRTYTRDDQLRGYALVRQRLATPGAPQRAAEEMVALLKARQ